MKPLTILLLSASASALNPQGYLLPESRVQEPDLDKCSAPQTVTQSYEQAMKQKSGSCPSNYWKVKTHGCCPMEHAAKTVGSKGVACCPCGAACTGYLPTPKEWADKIERTAAAEPTQA